MAYGPLLTMAFPLAWAYWLCLPILVQKIKAFLQKSCGAQATKSPQTWFMALFKQWLSFWFGLRGAVCLF